MFGLNAVLTGDQKLKNETSMPLNSLGYGSTGTAATETWGMRGAKVSNKPNNLDPPATLNYVGC